MSASKPNRRLALYKKGHRYRWWRRWLDIIVALGFVLAPPLLGWMRFDFWQGKHLFNGEQVTFLQALQAFTVPFIVINLIILIVTHQTGRFLCGWVCPTGVIVRWTEELESRIGKRPLLYRTTIGLMSLMFSTGVMIWFVDLRVYIQGSALAISLTALSHALVTIAVLFEMSVLRLDFCKKFCPSGVYFAVLSQRSLTGIKLLDRPDSPCVDCGLCSQVCPIGLEPRELLSETEPRGIYLQGMSPLSLCIRCGDCVTACDLVFHKKELPGVLQLGFDESFEEAPQKKAAAPQESKHKIEV